MASIQPSHAPSAASDAARSAVLECLPALQARVLAAGSFTSAAHAFVTELAGSLGYDRVSLGVRSRDAIELIALSHGRPGADVRKDRELTGAMEEAMAQAASVCVPADGGVPHVSLAHTGLAQQLGGSVCSIPLMQRGAVVGVTCFERRREPAPEPVAIEQLEHLLCLVGPVLHLRWLVEQPLGVRLGACIRNWCSGGDKPVKRIKRLGLGVAALLIVLAAFLPANWHVGGRARIEGTVQRALVAPLQGYLQEVHVRPGDWVQTGQVLVELADRDIRLEQRKWASQLSQHENAYAHAIARADRAQAVVHMARAAEAKAQLDLIASRLERVQVRAPFTGTIVAGDLAQSIGAPVELGANLVTVAAAGGFRVLVQVDERDIAAVRAGQEGTLSLSALPWDTLPLRVRRVSPIAAVHDGDNLFEVEAELLQAPESLRPGLHGVAKIAAGKRPLLQSWSQRLLDWARLALWSWTGWP